MSRTGHGRALAALVLIASLAPLGGAQTPLQGALPLADVELLQFDAVNVVALGKQDAEREAGGLPWRFALPRDLALSPADMGSWETLADGSLLWRLRIGARDAHSINLGFSEFWLPEGATLIVRAADGEHAIRPFTSADNEQHGQLWTPVLFETELVIELRLAAHQLDDYRLTLGRVGQGYRGFGQQTAYEDSYLSGSCNVDVVCPEGDDWQLEIGAVGAYTLNGSDTCTGVLLNDTTDSLTANFLTANHCGVSSSSDASIVIYWNYENSVCRPPFSGASGGSGDGPLTQFSSGSTHRASYSPSDVTLVELDDPVDPAWDLGYAGWTRSSSAPASAIAIHHPQVEEKRISFEFDPTSTTSYLQNGIPGDGTHVRITDWDVGTTEPGSSGSPLFDPEHRIIGQLHGGYASCSSQTSDWYGRFSVSWAGGGTPSTRLSDWLDPSGLDVMAVDSISLNTLCSDAGSVAFLAGSVSCEGDPIVRVVDCGLNLNDLAIEQVLISVSSSSEPGGESVTLTETSPASGRFEGVVDLSQSNGAGVLQVSGGDLVIATYIDADDGLGGGGVVLSDTAAVDCTAPSVIAVGSSGVTALVANVDVSANEPVTGVLHFGSSCASLNESVSSPDEGTALSFALGGLQDETSYYFSVEITDEAGNTTLEDNGGACFTFTTLPAQEYYTEEFLSDFDLAFSSLNFTPTPGPDGYSACTELIGALPVSSVGATVLSLSDDDSEQVSLTGGNSVLLYGVPYSSVWVGSNGYVTFGQSDTDYTESLSDHFDTPRVSALFDDLNPSTGGSVSTLQTAESLVITWFQVEQYSTGDQNTFQAELFFDGRLRLSWAALGSSDSVVGLSAGSGLQGDFLEENLSGLGDCGGMPSCQTDLGFGGPGTATLSMCGGDLSTGTTADLKLEGAAPNAAAYLFMSLTSTPTPIKGGVLVPIPVLDQFDHNTDGSGGILFAGVAGGGGPLSVIVQYVIVDASQPKGYAFSNALQIDFLP
ncbi:MAG: hypothetical protein DRQ55_17390 [Planctomycetota bacterium]|nr:MAG: hypothetical protein DRQ55_17390 [Planctomycetota bacterium]